MDNRHDLPNMCLLYDTNHIMHNTGANNDLVHRIWETFLLIFFFLLAQRSISQKYTSKECDLGPSLNLLEQNKLFATENPVLTQI